MINTILFLAAIILILIICFYSFMFYLVVKMNNKVSNKVFEKRKEEFNKKFLKQKTEHENSRVKKFFKERG